MSVHEKSPMSGDAGLLQAKGYEAVSPAQRMRWAIRRISAAGFACDESPIVDGAGNHGKVLVSWY
jgi:hypothetical protein